ncbi:ArnT family glycosyltransferase [Pseudolysinimonas sp.]|uniref:ArnT family glycosyltransferase n=1 Tax=Pseudolysinimonas sp. TaxID=2680009 RepID=UPI003F7E6B74
MSSPDLRSRLALWRGRPLGARMGLVAAVVLGVLFFTWNIGESGLSTYYAASAVSMAGSPHDLFVGALDRAGTTTLDKLSGFLVPQALAIRLFGVHAWALSLPQAVEGAVTIVAAYALGMRWRGPALAVAAALGTAFTPMLAAMFGRPMEDGLLTMASVLAVLAAQRGAITGHVRWFAVAALWVAIGFQAKMLQAWFVVPAVLALALLALPGSRGRRTIVALATGALTVGLSLSWVVAISLLPAGQRPYADGTTDGSLLSMVFGYNGADRIVPGLVPGSVPQLGGHGVQLQTRLEDAAHSPLKLLLPQLATQIGWLYPLALAGAVLLVLLAVPSARRRLPAVVTEAAPATAEQRGMTAALLLWVAVTALILTVAAVPHATYFAPIAVPLVLLAGFAGLLGARIARRSGRRGRLAVAGVVLLQTVWAVVVILGGPVPLRGLAVAVGVAGAAAAVLLAMSAPRGREWRTVAVAGLCAVAVGLAPVVWSSATLLPGGGGSASDAYAGPRIVEPGTGRHVEARTIPAPASSTRLHLAIRPPFTVPPDPRLTPEQRRLVAYVRGHDGTGRELFATDSMPIAVSIILETHDDAIPMGGFSHQAPTPSLSDLRALLDRHEIRYVLLIDASASLPPNPVVQRDRDWVRSACRPVLRGRFRADSLEHQTLYDCRA